MFQNIHELNNIAKFTRDGVTEFVLGADVGGSGVRVRICNYIDYEQHACIGHAKAQCTKDILEVFAHLDAEIRKIDPKFVCRGAAIAVAGPIKEGTVVMTNWAGEPSNRTLSLSQLPASLFPRGRSLFLNDLEAGAYGIIAMNKKGEADKYFDQLWTDKGAPKGKLISDDRTCFAAMGSGLGVALIAHNPLLEDAFVFPTECGHLQIASVCDKDPHYKEDSELIQFISDHYYKGVQMPEYEDISSGRGFCLTYQFLKMKESGKKPELSKIDAGEVAQMAQKGDAVAKKAMLYHYKFFMRACKAVATSLSCDSVVLALDNQVKNAWFFNSVAKEMHDEFYDFIRPTWMEGIRVYAQKEILNFNIIGTAFMAHTLAHRISKVRVGSN